MTRFHRNVNISAVVLPFVAIFAAWTLSAASARIRARPLVFWGLVALTAAPALVQSIRGADGGHRHR